MILNDYLNLIPQEHRNAEKFIDTVSVGVEPCIHIQDVMNSLVIEYDLDYAAGVQLDVVGKWVGAGRGVPVPITGSYFTWDDTVEVGWDQGLWQGTGDPISGVTELPDDLYRAVLKSKAISNSWKGDLDTIYEILVLGILDSTIDQFNVIDNNDMSMEIQTVDLTDLEQAIISQEILIVKPMGVGITYSQQASVEISIEAELTIATLAGWEAATIDVIKAAVAAHINFWGVGRYVYRDEILFVIEHAADGTSEEGTYEILTPSNDVLLGRLGDALLWQTVTMLFYENAICDVSNIAVSTI